LDVRLPEAYSYRTRRMHYGMHGDRHSNSTRIFEGNDCMDKEFNGIVGKSAAKTIYCSKLWVRP
jgi:hypothetical protein